MCSDSLIVVYYQVLMFLLCMYVYMYTCDRWGDNRSPAFGELSDSHFFRPVEGSKEDRLAMWGQVRFLLNILLYHIHSQEVYTWAFLGRTL